MYSGSIVAIVTPMANDGSVDFGALDALIDWHIASGTHGVVPVGTTGESATLDVGEHLQVIERVVKRVAGRIPVIAGTGANSTREAIELTHAAKGAGADACLLVTPYYNKPPQEGLYQHYKAVAEAVAIPQILYNVPGRTACDLLPATIARLAPIPNIIGIKEASNDVSRVSQIRAGCGEDFVILSGEDAKTLDMMKLGAVGTISVTANVVPALMSQFCAAALKQDYRAAEALDARLQPLHAMLFVETSPIPTKWALLDMGKIGAGIRLPLVGFSSPRQSAMHELLVQVGAIR